MNAEHKITFQAFSELVATRAKVGGEEADAYIHQLAKTMGERLEAGDDIHLYRFGRLHTTHVAEREGHDPNTGESLTIADHTRVHFRPYAALRFAVNAPFRQLRIRELTDDRRGWRTRTVAWLLLGGVLLLMALLGIWANGWLSAREASMGAASDRADAAQAPVAGTLAATTPAVEVAASAEPETTATPAATELAPVADTMTTGFTVSSSDTLWGIAATTMGSPFWWPAIYAENRPELSRRNPDLIDIGMALRIPVLTGSVEHPTAADFLLKTNAYRIVADDYRALGSPRAEGYAAVAARGFGPSE